MSAFYRSSSLLKTTCSTSVASSSKVRVKASRYLISRAASSESGISESQIGDVVNDRPTEIVQDAKGISEPVSEKSDPQSSNPNPQQSSTSKPNPYPVIYPSEPLPRHPDFPHSLNPSKTSIPMPQHLTINFPTPIFTAPSASDIPPNLSSDPAADRLALLSAVTGLSVRDVQGLHRFTVGLNRVSNMTKKGKIGSFTAMVVVGSPERGLVGIGRGKSDQATKAMDSGFHEAVLSMDYVDRYENRTIWGEMEYKWGATKVVLRGRPAGFGLHVPPPVHRLLTACGIRDASATIHGSANPQEVLKCTLQMLHGGVNPPGFGSGTGRSGRRVDKRHGMRSVLEIERERGRYGVNVGKRL